jgi:hypothetical protein
MDAGWLYLAAVKDLATMEIVGLLSAIAGNHLPGNGSMSERLKSTICSDALNPLGDFANRLPGNEWRSATDAPRWA